MNDDSGVVALGLALRHLFDFDSTDPSNATWESLARKLIAEMRDCSGYDIIESNYCEACPVRQRVERSIRGEGRRRRWFGV